MQTKDKCTVKAKKEVISYEDFNMDIEDITLLSADEYIKYKYKIPPVNFDWWLRSPDHVQRSAVLVGSFGSLRTHNVRNSLLYVRPAIVCKTSFLETGDKVKLFGTNWTVLDPSLFLCNGNIGRCAFREDWKAPDANDYEASDVKRYLHEWINRWQLSFFDEESR